MIACVKHVQWSNINVSVRVKYVLGSKLAISICDWMCEVCTRIIISNINLWLDVWSMYNDQISICDCMCEACTMIKYQFVIACVKHVQWSNINVSVSVKHILGSKLAISICDWMCEVCTRIKISNINVWLDVWSMYNDQISICDWCVKHVLESRLVISICDWMCEVCTRIKITNINLWLNVWSV